MISSENGIRTWGLNHFKTDSKDKLVSKRNSSSSYIFGMAALSSSSAASPNLPRVRKKLNLTKVPTGEPSVSMNPTRRDFQVSFVVCHFLRCSNCAAMEATGGRDSADRLLYSPIRRARQKASCRA